MVIKSRYDLSLMLILAKFTLENINVDLDFMGDFTAQGKFQDLFTATFGQFAFSQQIKVNGRDYCVGKPSIAYCFISIIISLMEC